MAVIELSATRETYALSVKHDSENHELDGFGDLKRGKGGLCPASRTAQPVTADKLSSGYHGSRDVRRQTLAPVESHCRPDELCPEH